MKHLLLLCLFSLGITSIHAQEATQINNCDTDTVASITANIVGFSDKPYEINCANVPGFTPFAQITQATMLEVYTEGEQTYLQLISTPNREGKRNRLNILISDNYADDAQLQGTGAGGYYVDGNKLYAYVYWGVGCKFDEPYEVERTTYEWNTKLHQYEQTDYIFYRAGVESARGWGCCDYSLLDAEKQLTQQEQQMLNTHLQNSNKLAEQFVWGEQARKLLAEAEQRISPQIQRTSLWRQHFCCRYENDEQACHERIGGEEKMGYPRF